MGFATGARFAGFAFAGFFGAFAAFDVARETAGFFGAFAAFDVARGTAGFFGAFAAFDVARETTGFFGAFAAFVAGLLDGLRAFAAGLCGASAGWGRAAFPGGSAGGWVAATLGGVGGVLGVPRAGALFTKRPRASRVATGLRGFAGVAFFGLLDGACAETPRAAGFLGVAGMSSKPITQTRPLWAAREQSRVRRENHSSSAPPLFPRGIGS